MNAVYIFLCALFRNLGRTHLPFPSSQFSSASILIIYVFFFLFLNSILFFFSSPFDTSNLYLVTESEGIGFTNVHRDNVVAYRATRVRKSACVLTALKICNGIAIAVSLHSTSVGETRYDIAGNGFDWLIGLTLISSCEWYRWMNTFGLRCLAV